MITSKKIALKQLIESETGLHLSAYLVNQGNLTDLNSQLRKTIKQFNESINEDMSNTDIEKFLAPLESLLSDSKIFREMTGNIGIFRSKNYFSAVNIPSHVEHSTHVATSFHIKPLLKWIQSDQEFLFLGQENDSATLYQGSQKSFKLIDSILISDLGTMNVNLNLDEFTENNMMSRLNEWIADLTKNFNPKLFVAGDDNFIQIINGKLNYTNTVKTTITDSISAQVLNDICMSIRKSLREDAKKFHSDKLLEFKFSDSENRSIRNLFEIAQAVVSGKVRKLVISDSINIFGKINKKNGGLVVHPYDLDHEDDDILDDLAQMVLTQGGEVIIASLDEIPNGRPAIAIIDDDENELEKFHPIEKSNYF